MISPLDPKKQTKTRRPGMNAMGQDATLANDATPTRR